MLIAFYILGGFAILGGFGVLVLRSPIYCALSLVMTMLSLAGVFVLLNQEFLAAIQVLVYAGAIMVLFLFVIMLLNLKSERGFTLKLSAGSVLGVVLSLGLLAQLGGVFMSTTGRLGPMGAYPPERLANEGSIEVLGGMLFTDYVFPFEVISILLLVAIMGAVLLAKKEDSP